MEKSLIEELRKRLPNTFKFCKGNFNKFDLMSRKVVYPDKYIKHR